jgi:hypothetical protein
MLRRLLRLARRMTLGIRRHRIPIGKVLLVTRIRTLDGIASGRRQHGIGMLLQRRIAGGVRIHRGRSRQNRGHDLGQAAQMIDSLAQVQSRLAWRESRDALESGEETAQA